MIPSPPLGTDATAGLLAPGAITGTGPEGAVAERRFRFELAAHPGSPAQARRLTRARLTAWSVCEDTCDTADLVISELVTNAIVHTASSRVVCELQDGADLVRIAVRDEGRAPGEPHPSPQRPEEEHGRGLFLVGAMCRSWGAQQHGPGLVVWAELARRTGTGKDATDATWDAALTAPATTDDTPVATCIGQQATAPLGPVHAAQEATGTAQDTQAAAVHEVPDTHEARGDLGWGARPKPYPMPDPSPTPHPAPPDDEDAPQAARLRRAYGPHGPHRSQLSHHTSHLPHEAHGTGAVWL
ncbi:ATP-binding protein [Streptomyces carpinensis]|uniref:ATP-binding protein n=1 Tax=Streptomyces carpinensis TaxID=66369 RepID=UPI003CC6B0EC